MTSLTALVAKDQRKVSAVYLLTDSRISSLGEESWDGARKTFASKTFPDIYAFCGDVLLPTTILGQFLGALDLGLIADQTSTFSDRVRRLKHEFDSALKKYPGVWLAQNSSTVVCCGRDGEGQRTSRSRRSQSKRQE